MDDASDDAVDDRFRSDDPQVQRALALAGRHAELLAERIGDELVGVYLIGSAALGDAWPHSDIDTVTVTREPITDEDLLGAIHDVLRAEHPDERYDTVYIPLAWVSALPADHSTTAFSLNGELHLGGPGGPIHPVTWVELCGAITVAGQPIEELGVAVDLVRAEAYTRANLVRYWAKVADQLGAAAAAKPFSAPLTNPYPVVWTVLGAPRLAAFLERLEQLPTGGRVRLVSKSEAGEWVVRHLPRFAGLARRCLDQRQGREAAFTVADVDRAADLVREVIVVVNVHAAGNRGRGAGAYGGGIYRANAGSGSPQSSPRGSGGSSGLQGER